MTNSCYIIFFDVFETNDPIMKIFFFLSKKNKILSVRIMYMICRYPNPWKNQNFLSDHLHFVLDNKQNHPSLPSLRTYLSNCRIPQRRNNQHHEFLLVSESLSSCCNQSICKSLYINSLCTKRKKSDYLDSKDWRKTNI